MRKNMMKISFFAEPFPSNLKSKVKLQSTPLIIPKFYFLSSIFCLSEELSLKDILNELEILCAVF